jgi:hypothetical protein
MGTTLTGKPPSGMYGDLLHLDRSGAGVSTGTTKRVSDGLGVNLPFELSTAMFQVTGFFALNGATVTATASGLNALDYASSGFGIVLPKKAYTTLDDGSIDVTGNIIKNPLLQAQREAFVDMGNVLSSGDIVFSSGTYHKVVLIGTPVALGFMNVPASGTLARFTVQVEQDSTGSRTINWPNVRWPSGSEPTLTTDPLGKDILEFFTYDGGVSYIGSMTHADIG